jgi:molecular chaperone Hsp33
VIARFQLEEREAMVGDDGMIRVDCAFCSQSFPIPVEDLLER